MDNEQVKLSTRKLKLIIVDDNANKDSNEENGYINNEDDFKVSNGNILYNYNHFMKRAREVHGNKFNYSKVMKNQVDGVKSKIIIICNNCNCEEKITISCHLKNKGCKKCKHRIILNDELTLNSETKSSKKDLDLLMKERINELSLIRKTQPKVKYNYDIFVYESRYLYGDIFDYNLIDRKNITTKQSKVKLICKICTYIKEIIIVNHMLGKGCGKCRGQCIWYYEIFIHDAKLIHGNKYDYSKIDPYGEITSSTKLPIICNTCKFEWEVTLHNHINNEKECPNCDIIARRLNFCKFINIAMEIHGNKYDYSKIDEIQINSYHCKILVICNMCKYGWNPVISDHIYSKSGCPRCARNEPYTLNIFIEKAKNVHGDKYNYSFIKESDIKNKYSKIIVICNICVYEWYPTIGNHIHNKRNCPQCTKRIKITLEIFKLRSIEIHGKKYNYELITEEHIKSSKSYVPIKCNKCSKIWSPTISSFINQKTGCPRCKSSKGELKCLEYLQTNKIIFKEQFVIHDGSLKKYDFMIEHENEKFLLEFDGIQHFKFIEFFTKNLDYFNYRQKIDIQKTIDGINNGYNIIRIDYGEINNIQFHLDMALKEKTETYFTNYELYSYIIDKL